MAEDEGIPTHVDYFEKCKVDDIIKDHGKADLVTASNVFAHSDSLHKIADNAFKILKDDGAFVVEVQYLLSTLTDLTFDNIYHEHTNYWSVTSIDNFFNNMDLRVYKIEFVNTHGGSIRVYTKRKRYAKMDDSVREFLKKEKDFGLSDLSTYKEFGKKVRDMKDNVRKNLDILKDKYDKIVGYAAPAKATTALNFFGVSAEDIDYII